MSTITKWATSKAEGLFVTLPADAYRLTLPTYHFATYDNSQRLYYDMADEYGSNQHGLTLPDGTYRLLGKGDAVTEEQCNGLFDCLETYEVNLKGEPIPDGKVYQDWWDYLGKWYTLEKSAESLQSLIRSHSLNPSEVVVLVKVN